MAIALGLWLPVVPLWAAPQSPLVPAGDSSYVEAWSVPISADGPLTLTFTSAGLVLTGPDTRTESHAVEDGRVLWTAQDGMDHAPALDADLLIGSRQGQLTALDAATGLTRWSVGLDGATRGAWVKGGRTVVSSGTELRAYRSADGTLLWAHDTGSPALIQPAASDAAVMVVLEDRTLAAFALADGAPIWRTSLDVTPLSLLPDGDRIYFGAAEGYACAHKQDHGRRDWCFPVRVRPIGAPVADARRVYFTFLDNMVHVFDRRSGRRYATPSLDALPAGGPRLTATHLVVPVVTGEFVLLNLASGLLASRVSTPRAEELPLTRAAAVSPDGGLLAVVIASPKGRTLLCFRRPPAAPTAPAAPDAPVTP